MQQERDPLNLSELPPVSPPVDGEDNWPAIAAALTQHRSRRRLWKTAGGALAAAATVTLVTGLIVLRPAPLHEAVPNSTQTSMTPPATSTTASDQLDSLVALSQQLERHLRRIKSEVGVMPTEGVIYQVELEDLVAQVDDALSMTPESTPLWTRRINLLLDLNQLYRNQLRREHQQMASL